MQYAHVFTDEWCHTVAKGFCLCSDTQNPESSPPSDVRRCCCPPRTSGEAQQKDKAQHYHPSFTCCLAALNIVDTGSTCYHVATQLLHVGLLFSRVQQALTSKVVHSLLFHQTVLLACFSTMSMRECTYELWHDKAVVVWCRQLLDSKRLL